MDSRAEVKIIAVVGATGRQGGGMARAVLADPGGGFTVRALTRDPSSDGARELAVAGAEVVAADLNDPASVRAAFTGAYGAFCHTFYWDDLSPETELRHARAMADAAAAAGLHHVVFSTLEDTRQLSPLDDQRIPTLRGRYKVPFYDGKADAEVTFRESGIPTTFLRTALFWENLIAFGFGPHRGADGTLALTYALGNARMPAIAARDIGKVAYTVFRRPGEFAGQTISIAGEHLTGHQMADQLTRALGEQVRYNPVPPDMFRTFPIPAADEIANMFCYYQDFEAEVCGARDLDLTRALNPDLQTFGTWLSANAAKIPL